MRVHRTPSARTASVLALALLAFTLSPGAQAALPSDTPDPGVTVETAPPTDGPTQDTAPADGTAPAGDPTTEPAAPATALPVAPDTQAPAPSPTEPAEPTEPTEPGTPAPTPDATPSPTPPAGPDPAPAPTGVEPEAQYVVLYADGTDVAAEVDELRVDGTVVDQTFTQAPAAVVTLTPSEAVALAATAEVEAVEPDSEISALATQPDAPWGLDRADQRTLPLSRTYSPPSTASGVTVYVVDTGVASGHTDFGGRVTAGWTALADGRGTQDCNGHGTHVAGTIGGSTYGVAKGVTLVPVRVLGCDGKGTLSDLLAGIDWITANHAAGAPAVANFSLGGVTSQTLDTSLDTMIDDGVSAVVAAGNDSVDACSTSPARVPRAVTVAASDSSDRQADFTNVGACVDLYAPGVLILSAGTTSPTATALKSGTSTAAPHVSGAAALILAESPAASPGQVADALVARATGSLVTGVTGGTPNRLLFVPPAAGAPAPPAGTSAPIGVIDHAGPGGPDSIWVTGWALDLDTSDPIAVHVYVDGAATGVLANGDRGDIAYAYNRGAAHGYSVVVPASPGTHQVCVYGINSSPGLNPLLGCRTVTVVNTAPIGVIDHAGAAGPDSISVSGWALDQDTYSPIAVHVYVDGVATGVLANGDRGDIAYAYNRGAAHGYSVVVPASPGTHQVCVYGINATPGFNPLLACRTVTVVNTAPIGVIDHAGAAGPRSISVSGWALDQDTYSPIAVHVYVDGVATGVLAYGDRPDLAPAYGRGPSHGYSVVLPANPGLHRVCVYGINSTPGFNPLLGCRVVAV